MSSKRQKCRGTGIALLSWMVARVTLLIFEGD